MTEPGKLFAKSDKEGLLNHTRKVAECINRLKDRLKNRNPEFDEIFWKHLERTAIIHDFGKATETFQSYIRKFLKKDDPEKTGIEEMDIEDLVPHGLMSPAFSNWFEWDADEEWLRIILSAVVFHHDRSKTYNYVSQAEIPPVNPDDLVRLKEEFANWPDAANLIASEVGRLNHRFLQFLVPKADVMVKQSGMKEVFDSSFQKKYIFLKGFLHRADHFASSSEFAPDKVEMDPTEIPLVEKNTLSAIKVAREDSWQFRILNECRGKNTILVGATGIGKTEFAFLWGAGEKLFFTLPMRTMTNEIFKRAVNVFGQNVGLMHSSAVAVLPEILKKQMESETADSEGHVSLSRNLAFSVVVSTGDQLLNVSLKYPTYEKIMATLGYGNLVIDEIQAYDADAMAIIVKTIEEVVALGGKFLLMTATLPDFVRVEIKKRIGDHVKLEEKRVLSKQGEVDTTKNRILLIRVNATDDNVDMEEFYIRIKEIIKSNPGKKLLITINTVKNSQQLFRRLHEDTEFLMEAGLNEKNLMLLHSRFIGIHKEKKITDLTEGKDEGIRIFFTTQIIEASVNIDFDILISELAPLDSLIQRMGRVNRNRGDFKEGKGECYIIGGYMKGTKRVYKKEILGLTNKLLTELDGKKISEEEKLQVLSKKYYDDDNYQKKMKGAFDKNLDALDNILLATSKSEAQRIFREIAELTIIPEEEMCNFKVSLLKGNNRHKALIDFSLSIRFNERLSLNLIPLATRLAEEVDIADIFTKKQLSQYFKGYFVPKNTNYTYDEKYGFYEKRKTGVSDFNERSL